MLEWVFGRCDGDGAARRDADRPAPEPRTRSTSTGSTSTPEALRDVLTVDADEWRKEIPPIREFFAEFGDKLPGELREALDGLEGRIERASSS